MHLQKNNPLKKILFLILIISILSGCSGLRSKYGSNKNDICYPHRDRVIQIQEKFNKDKWTDTAVGIGTGALLGAAIGAVTNGARGAVVGAIAGGITGGATGYARAKIKEASTKEQMLRTVNADIASNSNSIDRVSKLIQSLGKCRVGQYEEVVNTFKVKKINRSNAEVKLKAIDSLSIEDNLLIGEVIGKVERHSNQYLLSAYEMSELTDENFNAEKKQAKNTSQQYKFAKSKSEKKQIIKKSKSKKYKKVPAVKKQKKSFSKMNEVKAKTETKKKEASQQAYAQLAMDEASLGSIYADASVVVKDFFSKKLIVQP